MLISIVGMSAVIGTMWAVEGDSSRVASADSRIEESKSDPAKALLGQLQRLSFDLRQRPLSPTEREQVATDLSSGSADEVYRQYVDRWLDQKAFKRLVSVFFKFPPAVVAEATADSFFHRLSRSEGDAGVYFLASKGEGCPKRAIKTVRAWWSKKPVRICQSSWVPKKVFDEIGYCSGGAEPLMDQLPRKGCGCGPMLMGCLPPKGERPDLDALVKTTPMDEWFESASRIVAEDRPLDELVTTTRTWQNGFAEFLYARRDVLGLMAKKRWSRRLEKRIEKKLASVDLTRAARWVDRGGVYRGTGIWWTALAPQAYKMPVRPIAHAVLTTYLCSEFHAVNVDATDILASVGKDDSNLRTLSSIAESPMRFQKGCKGCHSPMDGAGGFLGEIQTPNYGSYPTGHKSRGEFFVNGDADFRGKGMGIAGFSKLLVAQPEFETCAVRSAFEVVMARPLQGADQPLFQKLLAKFKSNGHRWDVVVRELLASDAYRSEATSGMRMPEPRSADRAPHEVPKVVADMITGLCSNCHDEDSSLDLSNVPKPTDVETWKKILSKVSDLSMPPPKKTGPVTNRFPIDPSKRKKFVGALAAMLGPSLDTPQDPLRMNHGTWMSIVRQVADTVIPPEEVDAIARPFAERARLFLKTPRGLPPPYKVSVDRISEEVCRRVAEADADKPGRYAIATGDTWSSRDRGKSIRRLLTAIYTKPPTDDEHGAALKVLDEAHGVTSSWSEAWVAVCSIHLTSPKLFFETTRAGEP